MIPTKTIIITGTHHTPAIELIHRLRSDTQFHWQIYYLGDHHSSDNHINHTIVSRLKVPFYQINCGKFHRREPLKTLIGIPRIFTALWRSYRLLRHLKPDIVVSFGGYVSVPVIIAARLRHLPSITHEQTLTISLATKINSYFVDKIALSFDIKNNSTLPQAKTVVTGNLIRWQIFDTKSPLFFGAKFLTNKPIIYITGGNQGSAFINQLTGKLIPKLNDFHIIHQTGPNFSASSGYPYYFTYPFIESEDIGWILNHASIIITRAGANICQEIDLLNKKTILIPLPHAQQNEQLQNALWLQKRHRQTAVVVTQTRATPAKILSIIAALKRLPQKSPAKSTTNTTFLNLIHELV